MEVAAREVAAPCSPAARAPSKCGTWASEVPGTPGSPAACAPHHVPVHREL